MSEDKTTADNVNHPSHYNSGKIEVIDAIEDWQLGFHLGNVVKYVARSKHKNGIEDLKKAKWYLERFIQIQDSGETEKESDQDEDDNIPF